MREPAAKTQVIREALDEKAQFLYELSALLGRARTVDDIVGLLARFLPRYVEAEGFALYLREGEGDEARLRLHHLSQPSRKDLCQKLADSKISDWLLQNGKPGIVPSDFFRAAQVRPPRVCVLGMPLTAVDRAVGLVYVFTRKPPSEISLQELDILHVLAGLTGVTCENVQLYQRMERQNLELGRTQAYLYNILDSMIHGVVVLDTAHRITLLSKSAEILLGVSAPVALDERYDKVFTPEFAKLLRAIIEETVRSEFVLDREFSCRMRGGILIPLGISASRLHEAGGKPLGIIVILRDLSGAKRLATLSNLNRMKSDFISTVAHEFKVPLNLVVSSALILSNEMKDNLTEPQLKLLGFVRNGGTRLNALINDLLELSRIETANLMDKTEKLDPGELLDQVVSALRLVAERKQISLQIAPGPEMGFWGNHERLFQAFHNLVHNAIKYTLPGGAVSVTWRQHASGGAVEVDVADTGVGIPAKDHEKVFDEFVRLKDPRTAEDGTGLGLTIVKRIVEMHRGSVRLVSAPGRGTTFTVELPMDLRKQL